MNHFDIKAMRFLTDEEEKLHFQQPVVQGQGNMQTNTGGAIQAPPVPRVSVQPPKPSAPQPPDLRPTSAASYQPGLIKNKLDLPTSAAAYTGAGILENTPFDLEYKTLQGSVSFEDLLTKQGALSKVEQKLAEEMIKEREKEYNRKIIDSLFRLKSVSEEDQAYSMKTTALKNKISNHAATGYNAVDAFTFGSLGRAADYDDRQALNSTATTAPAKAWQEIAKARTGANMVDQTRLQSPIASTAGAFVGEGLKYGIGANAIKGIPVVGNLIQKAGVGLSGLTKGKISAEVMGRIAAGRFVDLPIDIINSAVNSDSPEEFAKNLGIYTATGLAMDGALEGIVATWKGLRGMAKIPLDGSIKELEDMDGFFAGSLDGEKRPLTLSNNSMQLSDGRIVDKVQTDFYQNHRGVSDDLNKLKIPMEKKDWILALPEPKTTPKPPVIAKNIEQRTKLYDIDINAEDSIDNEKFIPFLDIMKDLKTPGELKTFADGTTKQLDDLEEIRKQVVDAYADYIYHYKGQGVTLQPTFDPYLGELPNKLRISNNEPWYQQLAGSRKLNRADSRALAERVASSPKIQGLFPPGIVPDELLNASNVLDGALSDLRSVKSEFFDTDISGIRYENGKYAVDYGQAPREIEPGTEFVHPINGVYGGVPNSAKRTNPIQLETPKSTELPVKPNKPITADWQEPNIEVTPTEPLNQAAQLRQAYKKLDEIQSEYTYILKKGKFTDEELKIANGIRRGYVDPAKLPDDVDLPKVMELATAGKAVDNAQKPISDFNVDRRNTLKSNLEGLTFGSDNWKDKKKGFQYMRETMERNMEDIVPDRVESKKINDAIFERVHDSEANRIRFLNKQRDTVRGLGLSAKESELVQMLGEGIITPAEIPKEFDLDKIKNAVTVLKNQIYPSLLDQVNDTLVLNGYRPIKPRKNYFPHFSDPSDPLSVALSKMGININVKELPTDIAGRTHEFKPGKQWFGNFEQRKGDQTVYDAVRGFDQYIEGISNVIYHTDDIQNLRTMENVLRAKYSDKGLKKRIDDVYKNKELSTDEIEQQVQVLLQNANTDKLPNFVTNLRSYTDSLAGKKSISDRNTEHAFGRCMYDLSKAFSNRVSANMVAVNPGSWITNFIPLIQAGDISKKNILKGMFETLTSGRKELKEFIDSSTFLTNRHGSKSLQEGFVEKLSAPMEWIDNFTSDSIVRAKYYDNLKTGLDPAEAIRNADSYAARLIADRSKGALPTIFETRNAAMKLLTSFQVEVNNQLSFAFKDLARGPDGKRRLGKLAGALTSYAVGAYIYNDVYENLTGRRPALDPIGIVNEAVGDATGNQIPNMVDNWEDFKDGNFQTGKDGSIGVTGVNLSKNIAENIPFVGGLLGGGRLPIQSAIPDFAKLWSAASKGFTGEIDSTAAKERAWKELAKLLAYAALPVGGGQIKKTTEGLYNYYKGGSYSTTTEGEKQLNFPVEQNFADLAKSALFGKYATKGGRDYIDSGFKPALSVKDTAAMESMKLYGVDPSAFLRIAQDLRGLEADQGENGGTVSGSLAAKQRDALLNADLSASQKKRMDQELIRSTKDGKPLSADYSAGREGIELSLMEEKTREMWGDPAVKKAVGSLQDFQKLQKAISGAESDKDEYGNPIAGSAEKNKIAAISKVLQVDEKKAKEIYKTLNRKRKIEDFSSADRKKYKAGLAPKGMTVKDFIKYNNIIDGVKGTEALSVNEMRKKVLVDSGISEANAEYFVNAMYQKKYSLKDFTENQVGKYQVLAQRYNLSERRFIEGYNAISQVEGKKDAEGKTISGSLKSNRLQALIQAGYNEPAARIFLTELYGYKW